MQAATEQMRRLPYATGYFDFASEPAIRLAAQLAEITPASLTRAYLTLGGSEAVDAAVRFIVQYWNAVGRPAKKHFIALERGYHGSSSTGAGLTALPAFHRGFDLPLADPALHPVAQSVPPPAGPRPAGADRRVGRGAAGQGGRVGGRQGGRLLLRTDPGLRRGDRAAAGMAEGDARRGARARHPVRGRRGHHRLRPHRPDVRLRCRGRRARPDDTRQGLDLGLCADGRHDAVGASLCRHRRRRAGGRADRTWRDLLRASGRRGGRARGAQALRRRRSAGERAARRAVLRGRPRCPARASAGGRCAPPRTAGCAGARQRQGDQARLRCRRSACPSASSRRPTATACCSAASATASLALRRR